MGRLTDATRRLVRAAPGCPAGWWLRCEAAGFATALRAWMGARLMGRLADLGGGVTILRVATGGG